MSRPKGSRNKKDVLYIKYTKDKYALPEYCTTTAAEMAELVGTTKASVLASLAHDYGTYGRFYFKEGDDI